MANVEALFAAVYAQPEADAPRLVLADFLLQRNDPRGEFIALQMAAARGQKPTAAQTRRERALLTKHEAEWLAPLEGIKPVRRVWQRGFVAELSVNDPSSKPSDDPSFSTVRRLTISGMIDRVPGLLASAHWRSLEAIGGLTVKGLARLLTARPPAPLEEVELFSFSETLRAEAQKAIARLDELPRLRRLQLHLSLPRGWSAASLVWLWRSTFARRLRQMELDMDPPLDVAGCLLAAEEGLPSLETLTVKNAYFAFRFTRDAHGRLRALEVIWSNLVRAQRYLAWVTATLGALPAKSLTSFALSLGETRFSAKQLAPLRKVVASRLA